MLALILDIVVPDTKCSTDSWDLAAERVAHEDSRDQRLARDWWGRTLDLSHPSIDRHSDRRCTCRSLAIVDLARRPLGARRQLREERERR